MSNSKSPVGQTSGGGAAAGGGSDDASHHREIADEFIAKTYELVEDPSVNDLISWNRDGSSFIVWKPKDFSRDLLPKYFNHDKFSRFVRQLTNYGFQKVVPERWEFANELFKRGEKLLLPGIKPLMHKRKANVSTVKDDIKTVEEKGKNLDDSVTVVEKGKIRDESETVMEKQENRDEFGTVMENLKNRDDFVTVKEQQNNQDGFMAVDGKEKMSKFFVFDRNLVGNREPLLAGADVGPSSARGAWAGFNFREALSYSALFPLDYDVQEETIVQLWLADGFVVREPMEQIASQFLKEIGRHPFYRSNSTNLVTGNTMYKSSGLISKEIIPRESSTVIIDGKTNLTDLSPDVSRISILCGEMKDLSTVVNQLKRYGQLRMVMFLQGNKSSFKQLPRDFFLSLRLLRILDLSRTHLMELPSSIANLKCLRYIDLSHTPIKSLPEAISNLQNLQTLKLRGCLYISTLPKGMRKLVKLRHLDIDVLGQLSSMPQGIGALTNLRTLSAFIVGMEEGCNIKQLMNLNNLTGSFCISRLENVLTDDEAKDACLHSKSQLKTLELRWSELRGDIKCYEKVLSSLRPNESLVELCISGYGGSELPSWLCCPKFSMLVSITIIECENCLCLPSSLGELPSLRYLHLSNFPKLKVIDHSFFGIQKGYTRFPKLEKLTVEDMISLKEFTGTGGIDFCCLTTLAVRHCPELNHIFIFSSCLEYLEISHCARLIYWADEVPYTLNTFIIEDCPTISASFLYGGVHYRHKMAHVPNVWIDHQEIELVDVSIVS